MLKKKCVHAKNERIFFNQVTQRLLDAFNTIFDFFVEFLETL